MGKRALETWDTPLSSALWIKDVRWLEKVVDTLFWFSGKNWHLRGGDLYFTNYLKYTQTLLGGY